VVVVAAAGNGAQNLDAAAYFDYRQMGDSGAIIVGAGQPDTAHTPHAFSTFGERVDVHAWGSAVFSLGYGDFAAYGGDKNQRYTQNFNGTSSASALVAGVCCLLQEASEALAGARLGPRDLRSLLETTGIPQGAGVEIGPFPDTVAALQKLPQMFLPRWKTLGGGSPGVNGVPVLVGDGDLTTGSLLTMTLLNGPPNSIGLLWLAPSSTPVSFASGTLYAFPFLIGILLPTDGFGTMFASAAYPPAHPSGTSIWYQMATVDSTVGGIGASLSNGVMGTTP
jgi:hypothetical protein